MAREYRMTMLKENPDGQAVINTQSPNNESTSSPKSAIKSSVLITYGKQIANQTVNTVVADLRASGNEQIATQVTNLNQVATMGVLAVATGGLSLIGNAVQGASTMFLNYRQVQRENRRKEYDEMLRGSRREFNTGRGVFD